MADQDIITRETLEQQPFIDRHWLFYNALRRETVLEYFSLSKFYDRRSCNEELRMQGAKDIRLEHLGDMTGVQFVAEEVEGPTTGQPIFVIKKVLRSSRTKLQVLDVYYVLDGMIYQAPTILSVLNARLRRCAFMLNRAQSTLSRCVGFEMGQGDMYRLRRSLPVGGGGGEAREEEMMMDIDAHRSQGRKGGKEGVPSSLRYPSVLAVPVPHPEGHQAVERVLLHLIEEYPAPTPASHIEKDRRSMMVGGPAGRSA